MSSTQRRSRPAPNSSMVDPTNKRSLSSHRKCEHKLHNKPNNAQQTKKVIVPKLELNGHEEKWCELLQQRGDHSTFSHFDPLRTLHFLSKELQFKLKDLVPESSSLNRILGDMQQALNRVPPELASSIHLQQNDWLNKKNEENVQKLMEENTLKLETSCRQLETLCNRLQSEKEDLTKQLQEEKQSNFFLKQKIQELELEKATQGQNKDKLQRKLSDLQDKVSDEYESLKITVKDLKNEKQALEKDAIKWRQKCTVCNMEKEKLSAILQVRTKQINEMRDEMAQLQLVVNEELLELHNKGVSSLPTSTDNILEQDLIDAGDAVPSTINTIESLHGNETAKRTLEDMPSGDQNVITMPDTLIDNCKIPSNLRELLNDIKKQSNITKKSTASN